MSVGASEVEDRVRGSGADGGESGCPGSAEEGKQRGLGLIVCGVAEQCIGPEESKASGACPGLEVRAVAQVSVFDSEGGAELAGDRLGGPGVVIG